MENMENMENMEKYHIGHEIEKEMRAKGMTARELAGEINLSPHAVYDIFKKNYIATDRLAMVQRVLGRDFFKELSEALKNGGILDKKEDESVVRERFEMLMPEDKLRVIDRELFYQLAEEFVNTEHHKPLVIFSMTGDRFRQISSNYTLTGTCGPAKLSILI